MVSRREAGCYKSIILILSLFPLSRTVEDVFYVFFILPTSKIVLRRWARCASEVASSWSDGRFSCFRLHSSHLRTSFSVVGTSLFTLRWFVFGIQCLFFTINFTENGSFLYFSKEVREIVLCFSEKNYSQKVEFIN